MSLVKGNPSECVDWGTDPLTAARRWEREGADGLHVVDLDRAFGSASNQTAIRGILENASIPVQVGGGIRSVSEALTMLDMGAARVVVGTLAFSAPDELQDLIGKAGKKSLVVAVDHREGTVVTHGWRQSGSIGVFQGVDYVRRFGVETVLVTATERDGTGMGPDFETYRELGGLAEMRILASGGIRSAADVRKLDEIGLEGAILGRALYDGSIRLAELGAGTA